MNNEEEPIRSGTTHSRSIQLTAATEINVAASLEIELSPGDQSRDWKRRWDDLEREIDRLEKRRTDEFSGENIREAERELLGFYVHAYHLRDALIAETPKGVAKDQVDGAISGDPDLALLRDLATVEKHVELNQPPRSGEVPTIGPTSGKQAGSGEGGWRLRVQIIHGGQVLDGLEVARRSVEAWRRWLAGWGLI